jgi:hypothetical protein
MALWHSKQMPTLGSYVGNIQVSQKCRFCTYQPLVNLANHQLPVFVLKSLSLLGVENH